MKKSVIIMGAVVVMILLSPFVRGSEERAKVKEFIREYGWEIKEEVLETTQISIPKPLDSIYKRYNLLQKGAGFDLGKYAGKKARRYTYEVLNHKFGKDVYINVLMCDGEVIGADVMTRALDGFMHGINRREYINEAG